LLRAFPFVGEARILLSVAQHTRTRDTTMIKAIRNPFHVRKVRGTKIKPEHRAVLDTVYEEARQRGYTVLGSLTARMPGMLTFFATAYQTKWTAEGEEGLPPFGVIRVHILRNGDVTCRVMGTSPASYITIPTQSVKFGG
jgi:hypothetical protein